MKLVALPSIGTSLDADTGQTYPEGDEQYAEAAIHIDDLLEYKTVMDLLSPRDRLIINHYNSGTLEGFLESV